MTGVANDTRASAGEIQTVTAARRLTHTETVFIGVGRPSTAALLARKVHNPDLVLVYESGTIGAKPFHIPLSIGDGELAETADAVVSVPEMFNYWIGPGRVEVAFLGAAQVDRLGNLNSTVIGDYGHPKTRLPGAGGAPEIAACCQEAVLAADRALVTVERIVDELEPKPGGVVIPGWVIDAVAEAPGGSQPSYSLGVTTRDNDFYRLWDKLSRDRDEFESWMRAHVLEPTKASR